MTPNSPDITQEICFVLNQWRRHLNDPDHRAVAMSVAVIVSDRRGSNPNS
jgi:hypothetical protein